MSDEGEEHVRRGVVGVPVPELVSDWRCQEIATTTTATHRETSNRSLIQRFFSRSPQLVVLSVKTICPAVDSKWSFARMEVLKIYLVDIMTELGEVKRGEECCKLSQ